MSAQAPTGSPASRQPSTTPNNGQGTIRRRKPTGPFAPKPSRPIAKRPPAPPPQNLAANAKPLAATSALTQSAPEPDDDPSTYQEYPLVSTKKALLEGLRFHAMKFISDAPVNPYDREKFERPVKLHRRFPRDTPNVPVVTDPEDDKEREKEAIRRAEKQAEREATQAQIAPTDKTAAAKKRQPFKKKTQDILYPTDTPEAKKRQKLRYEEGRPWHLEDFENKNIWVGTYEEPLSETNAMFLLDSTGSFRMVPIEKWYRFNPTQRYKTMTLDEAEAHMNKKMKDSRWFLENDTAQEMRRAELERQARLNRGRVGMRGERRIKNEDEEDRMDVADDVDELDFEADEEFQDDDEGKLFGDDEEEAKEAATKIRKERHEANIFAGTGVKEEKDWFEEEEKEKQKEREEKKKAKKLRKKLIKIEKNYEYDTDDSDNPYSSESDSEDSDIERQREEDERKTEEERKANGEVPASQLSTSANTPSGRAEKHGGGLQPKPSMSNLKRPGSPNLSETSGSESTRKRLKKQHRHNMSGAASPTGRLAGSGSDTETERRPRHMTLPARSTPGSPVNATPGGSRAGSPVPMPTAEEIKAAIPAAGISISDLIRRFREQVPKTKEGNAAFIGLVKSVARIMPGGLVGLR